MATPTTLPATFVSGAVLTAAQMNDLRGAFRVLQVFTRTTSEEKTNSTTTLEDTTLTAPITPTSTASKILVFVNHPSCDKSAGNSQNALTLELHRGASYIYTIGSGIGFMNSAVRLIFAVHATFLDSPASVAALVYKTKFANQTAAGAVTVQQTSNVSTITLMEISA